MAEQGPYLEQIFPLPTRKWPLSSPTFCLGRNLSCDAVFKGERISREHARIYKTGGDEGAWVLQDLSSNGIYERDGTRLGGSGIRPLCSGDEFDLGEVGELRIRFCAGMDEPTFAATAKTVATPPPPAVARTESPRTTITVDAGRVASQGWPADRTPVAQAEPSRIGSSNTSVARASKRPRDSDTASAKADLPPGAGARLGVHGTNLVELRPRITSRSAELERARGTTSNRRDVHVAAVEDEHVVGAQRNSRDVLEKKAMDAVEERSRGVDRVESSPHMQVSAEAGCEEDEVAEAMELSQEDTFLLAYLTADHPPCRALTSGRTTPPSASTAPQVGGPRGHNLPTADACADSVASASTLGDYHESTLSGTRAKRAIVPCTVLHDATGEPVAQPLMEAASSSPAEDEPDDALQPLGEESAAAPSRCLPTPSAVPAWMVGFRARPSVEASLQAEAAASSNWLEGQGRLCQLFGAPPFTVLDARKGYWKKRRQWWENQYQIHSERGRGDNLIGYKGLGGDDTRGTSVFCPVLTELCYKWWCPVGGTVLDPFAGGSVRGCVAGRLGLSYVGIELSERQVEENRLQAVEVEGIATAAGCRWRRPEWVRADARQLDEPQLVGAPTRADFIFSCPPYFNLERYSDDPRDLSNASSYADFIDGYRAVIAAAARRLAPRRFACFVVGEIRDENGFMRNFVGETIDAFQEAGFRLYNSAVMLFPLHTLPMRVSKQFSKSHKLGMSHQHVLVFYNGRQPEKEVADIDLSNSSKPLEWR